MHSMTNNLDSFLEDDIEWVDPVFHENGIKVYVKEDWEKTQYGGWSHIPQQRSWNNILQWQIDMFFYSCYLYYVKDTPKLSDEDFDRIIDIMEAHFDELPERITMTVEPGKIKPNAHLFAHDLSVEEIKAAIEWKNA